MKQQVTNLEHAIIKPSIQKEIKEAIFNALDLLGSSQEAARVVCNDYDLDYKSREVQSIIFNTQEEYYAKATQ